MSKAAGFDDDLGRWERKALKALKAGKPARVSFESAAIPSETAVLLRDRLAKVTDVAGVREAFDLAKAAGESDAPLAGPRPSSATSSPTGSSARVTRSWTASDSGRRLYP
jgi:hypothetical protein